MKSICEPRTGEMIFLVIESFVNEGFCYSTYVCFTLVVPLVVPKGGACVWRCTVSIRIIRGKLSGV